MPVRKVPPRTENSVLWLSVAIPTTLVLLPTGLALLCLGLDLFSWFWHVANRGHTFSATLISLGGGSLYGVAMAWSNRWEYRMLAAGMAALAVFGILVFGLFLRILIPDLHF